MHFFTSTSISLSLLKLAATPYGRTRHQSSRHHLNHFHNKSWTQFRTISSPPSRFSCTQSFGIHGGQPLSAKPLQPYPGPHRNPLARRGAS
ncbi:hypothetical protein BDW66DRAFT_134580, partial [Aspergillus desertorum]